MPDLSAFPITARWPAKYPDRLQLAGRRHAASRSKGRHRFGHNVPKPRLCRIVVGADMPEQRDLEIGRPFQFADGDFAGMIGNNRIVR